ncbi:MAG: extracellular solute-binding protein, partial [Eubacteriales bacterium]|nr:extracellular solute-binding protein [Eubacteriales bacterium]
QATTAAQAAEVQPTTEEITLRWVGAGWEQNDKAKNIIAKWESKYPNIHVQYIDLGTVVDESALANIDTMIGGGETVDVLYLTYDEVYKRVMNGGALPLDEYIAGNGDNYEELFGSLSTAMLQYEGNIYGVPYAGNTFKVFYNKDMTDAAGITIPESWSVEEFTETAKKLAAATDADVSGVVMPYTWAEILYVPALISGWNLTKRDASGNVVPNFDDETFKKSIQWAHDLASVEKLCPDLATMKAESINRRQYLASGKTAMIIDGPYTLVWLQNYMYNDPGEGDLPFTLGVTNLPYATEAGKDVCYNTLVGAFYVPKTAQYPAEAYLFEKFICEECNGEAANYMPISTKADMKAATKSFTEYIDKAGVKHENVYPQEVAEAAVATPFESHVGRYGYDATLATYNSLMLTLYSEQYPLYLNGEMELDEWVEMMQDLGATEIANAN